MSNSTEDKQRYVSCFLLEHGMMFDHCNVVRYCCMSNKEHGGRPIIFNNFHGELFNVEEFFKTKRLQRELMKQGTLPPECIGCYYLEERDWDDKDYIDNIIFAHWLDCNSNCIYCAATSDDNVHKMNKHYDIYPAIKDLVEKKYIVNSGKIDFAGGEPTIYPEFEKLLTLFIDNKFKKIDVNTSCVKYSPAVAYALEKGVLSLIISIDAGTEELHKKIKRVSSFDKVWSNILLYSKSQKKSRNLNQICLKYLIVPGVNDDIDEFNIFFDNVAKSKVRNVALSLDMFWYEEHKTEDNSRLIEKLFYFVEESNRRGFNIHIYPWAQWLIEQKLKEE